MILIYLADSSKIYKFLLLVSRALTLYDEPISFVGTHGTVLNRYDKCELIAGPN